MWGDSPKTVMVVTLRATHSRTPAATAATTTTVLTKPSTYNHLIDYVARHRTLRS